MVAQALDVSLPEASFYLWAKVPGDDAEFARELYREQHVTVLPGSYLARDAPASTRRRLYPHCLVAPLASGAGSGCDICPAASRIADAPTALRCRAPSSFFHLLFDLAFEDAPCLFVNLSPEALTPCKIQT